MFLFGTIRTQGVHDHIRKCIWLELQDVTAPDKYIVISNHQGPKH